MTFKFHCECGQKLSATDDMIGTDATCPNCSTLITVAPPSPATRGRPEPIPPVPPSRHTDFTQPRPEGLIRGLALLASLGLSGVLAWLLSARFFRPSLDSQGGMFAIFLGITIALFLASVLAAVFLRMAVKIVARFNLPFGEATWMCLLVSSISLASFLPKLVLAQQPDLMKSVLPLSSGLAFVLLLACFACLIWNDRCEPIGWARGVLTYVVFLLLFAVVFGGSIYLLWRMT